MTEFSAHATALTMPEISLKRLTTADLKATAERVKGRLTDLRKTSVLVFGDVGLDEYVWGAVRRISPEAPVPVLEVESEDIRSGLAANVAQNISTLGGSSLLLGLTGHDQICERLEDLLKKQGVQQTVFVKDADRPTTRKVRVMSGQHHIVRIDFEKKDDASPQVQKQLLEKLENHLPQVSGLVLQDYGKGIFTRDLAQKAISLAHKMGKRVLVDPHRTTPIENFKGADFIKPNREEAFILSGLGLEEFRHGEEALLRVGQKIREKTACGLLAVTQSKDGVFIFSDGQAVNVPTVAKQVFDVTGAGDTFLAAFSLAWLSEFSVEESALVANAASGVVVGKVGSVPCTLDELKDALEHF